MDVVLNTVVLVILSVIVESGVILRTCVWLLLMIETCLCFCHHLLLSIKGMCVVDNMLQYSSVRCMYPCSFGLAYKPWLKVLSVTPFITIK